MNKGTRWFERSALDQAAIDDIQTTDTVLDIGCGLRPQSVFSPKLHIMVEPHWEYAQVLRNFYCGRTDVQVLQATAQSIVDAFASRSVDTVFLLDVIEHIDKEEGLSLLKKCSQIARRQVVIFTPLGYVQQDHSEEKIDGWGLHGGEWQSHRSGWQPDDFDDSWQFYACRDYHVVDSNGEPFDEPQGAFWGILDVDRQRGEERRDEKRIAVVSPGTSAYPLGQPVAMLELIKQFDTSRFAVISSGNYISEAKPALGTIIGRLFDFVRSYRSLQQEVGRSLTAERCSSVLVYPRHLNDLLAVFLACRQKNVPFVILLLEDNPALRLINFSPKLSMRLSAKIFKAAADVVVFTEELAAVCQRNWQVNATIVTSPNDIHRLVTQPTTKGQPRLS